MADQLPENYYDNFAERKGIRSRKLAATMSEFVNDPFLREVLDPWSKKTCEDLIANPDSIRTHSRELEVRNSQINASGRICIYVTDDKLPSEPDGTVWATETLNVTVSFNGIYSQSNLTKMSTTLAWMLQVTDACSVIQSKDGIGYEKYVFRTSEQTRRVAEREKKYSATSDIVAAIKRDGKGTRKGSTRRFKRGGLQPGTYDAIKIDLYGGKISRTYDVYVYADGTGYFTRKT